MYKCRFLRGVVEESFAKIQGSFEIDSHSLKPRLDIRFRDRLSVRQVTCVTDDYMDFAQDCWDALKCFTDRIYIGNISSCYMNGHSSMGSL